MKYRAILVASAALTALAIGCSQVPQAELDSAKSAVEAAKKTEAATYAAEEFSSAQDSLKAGISEIEKQKSIGALSRNYEKAQGSLLAAIRIATSARTNAAAGREKAKTEAGALIEKTLSSCAEAKILMVKTPKKDKTALDSIDNNFKNIETSIGEAKLLVEKELYADAIIKATNAMTAVDSVKVTINGLSAKKNTAKK